MRKSFNHIWTLCMYLAVILLAQTSCSDDESSGGIAAKLTPGKPTSHSLSFTITPQYTEKCTWVCVKKGDPVPSAEEILGTGIPVDVSQTTTHTAIALDAKTEYVIIAAASHKGKSALSAPLEMSTLEKALPPEDDKNVKLRVLADAAYRTDNKVGAGNYVITLATEEPGQDGYPAKKGDIVLQLDLSNIADKDPINATLPTGEYLPGSDYSPFTWNPAKSIMYVRTGAGEQGTTATIMADGTVTVEREGDIYSIKIEVEDLAGEKLSAYYTGPIVFVLTGASSYDRFTTPQNLTFEYGQARYYGNWFRPHADDLLVQFFQGQLDEKNNLVDGYYLQLSSVYMNKLIDFNVKNPALEEGTYKVSKTSSLALTSIPFTLDPGSMKEILGETMPSGSYLTRIDAGTGKKYIGFIVSGTMKVVHSGGQYQIHVDFMTQENISVKGVFSSSMIVKSYNNNEATMIPRPWSTLTEDVKLNFPSDAKASAVFLGQYLYPGLNSWWLILSSAKNDKGDMITSEFFTPADKGMVFEPGTYVVSRKFEAYQLMPGFQQYGGGEVNYTWYGDLSSQDAEGYSSKLAPIENGTMKVQKDGDTYRFVFDFKDDAGHAITGEWSGPVSITKHESAVTKAKKSIKSSGLKKH